MVTKWEKYTAQSLKDRSAKGLLMGGKVSQISIELDLHENTIYNWLQSCRSRNGMAFVGSVNIKPEEAEMKRLQQENKELREAVEILKKAAAYFARTVK